MLCTLIDHLMFSFHGIPHLLDNLDLVLPHGDGEEMTKGDHRNLMRVLVESGPETFESEGELSIIGRVKDRDEVAADAPTSLITLGRLVYIRIKKS
jgi:hypothetical protein